MHQMVIYVGGIGALGTPQSRFEEAVTGNTMDYKIRYVYRVIVDNYVDGDEIFLFGYSRGAFTARAVVGLIEWAGILKKSNMHCFDAVWCAYTMRLQESKDQFGCQSKRDKAVDVVRNVGGDNVDEDSVHPDFRIRCVGVFDTVGSLKAPPLWLNTTNDLEIAKKARKRYDGLEIDLDKVENVFQALALDERRFDFYPAVLAKSAFKGGNSKQTWFAGVHSDMGGRGMSSLGQFPLTWMVSKLQEVNLLELDDDYIRRNILTPVVNADSKSRLEWIKPSHFIDCHPNLRRFLPARCLPWFRYAHRNPNMPAALIAPHSDSPSCSPRLDAQYSKSILENEQKFHWTVKDRLISGKGNYWEVPPEPKPNIGWSYKFFGLLEFPTKIIDLHINNPQSCIALRRPNPWHPKEEISIADVEARVDCATGIDEELHAHFRRRGDDCVIL